MKVISSIVLVVAILTLLGGFSYYFAITKDLSLSEANLGYKESTTTIYDLNNQVINKSHYVDDYISVDEMPVNLLNAFISIEDKRFYKHNGLDYIRIAGAVVHNIKSFNVKEGASTISQQLIKNTHLTAEKSISRKIQEARLAVALENHYEKDEILEMYLNAIYFGNGVYGVQNASERYFNKSCKALTLSECAMLAGIVKNPSKYSPVNNYDNSIERRNRVLSLMSDQNMISPTDYEQAKNEKVEIKYKALSNSEYRPYVKNVLIQAAELLNISIDELITKNYKINTYMDDNSQRIVTSAVYNNAYYKANSEGYMPDGMGILVDNSSAGIIAYSSTTPYHAYEVLRQPGSAIKPISVYVPALEYNIISPATQILDEETTFGDYSPKNYNGQYYGWVSARDALSKSMNVPAVKILSYVGTERALGYMEKFGFTTKDENSSLALALGGTYNGASIIQMAGAYRTLADKGAYREISFVKSIVDNNGKVIYSHNGDDEQIISEDNAYLITDMLMSAVDNGTSSKLGSLPYDVAGKTGTVSANGYANNSDAWSASYTTSHTLCIWQGNTSNNKERMLDKGITGGSYPTMMARDIYRTIYRNNYPDSFVPPIGIVALDIDKVALETDHLLLLASENTPDEYKVNELFSINNQPKELSEYFVYPSVDNFRVEMNDNTPAVKFIAKRHIRYTILRTIGNDTNAIDTIIGQEGEINYNDITAPKNTVIKYTIIPSIILENKEIEGKPSNTIAIMTLHRYNNLFDRYRRSNRKLADEQIDVDAS